VAQEQQRLLARSRLEPRVHTLTFRIIADELRGDAFFDEQVAQIHRTRGLVSRRIAGVDLQVRDQRIFGLPVEWIGCHADRFATRRQSTSNQQPGTSNARGAQAFPTAGAGIVNCTAGVSSGTARYGSKQWRHRASYEESPTSTCALPPETRCE
jgi:hypothetical protein